jgi:hypothetical protein
MTHDEMIEVIQAHKDGKVIQCRLKATTNAAFKDRYVKHAFMDFATHVYRAKPEPKEYWLVPYLDGSGFKVLDFNTSHLNSDYCERINLNLAGAFHVKEVIEELTND